MENRYQEIDQLLDKLIDAKLVRITKGNVPEEDRLEPIHESIFYGLPFFQKQLFSAQELSKNNINTSSVNVDLQNKSNAYGEFNKRGLLFFLLVMFIFIFGLFAIFTLLKNQITALKKDVIELKSLNEAESESNQFLQNELQQLQLKMNSCQNFLEITDWDVLFSLNSDSLNLNSNHQAISRIQRKLRNFNLLNDEDIDGIWGPITQQAFESFLEKKREVCF